MQHRPAARRARLASLAAAAALALGLATQPVVGEEPEPDEVESAQYERLEVLSLGVVAGAGGKYQIVLAGDKITRVRGSNAVDLEVEDATRAWLARGSDAVAGKY